MAEFKYDVFISYSPLDHPVVLGLAERLTQDGVKVWLADWEIKHGQLISKAIEKGLQDSRALLAVMSSNVFSNDWSGFERRTNLFRNPFDPDRRLISLRIDDTPPKGVFRHLAYIDWRDRSESGYEELLRACIGKDYEPKHKEIRRLEEFYRIDISPDEYKIRGDKLVYLDLNRRGLTNLEPMSELSDLTTLRIGFNHIVDLAPISGLRNLRDLVLSNNVIENIAPLSTLINLETLSLRNNVIRDIAPLASLSKIEILWCSINEIEDISAIRKMSQLKGFSLSKNEVRDFRPIGHLTKLTKLSLHSNNISDISFLSGIKTLEDLNLQRNDIRDFDPLLDLDMLERVNLINNPCMDVIPSEEYKAGWQAVRRYFQAKRKSEKRVSEIKEKRVFEIIELRAPEIKVKPQTKEVKLLLLGNGYVGKSSLLSYLKDPEGKIVPERTFGIEYTTLNKFVDHANINVWDFGGQEYFHATHKLFFSPNAVHVVMWNSSGDQESNQQSNDTFELEYWLRCIEQLGSEQSGNSNNIDVIVVENKIDEQGYVSKPLNQILLKGKFSNINFHFAAMSLMERRRVEGFKELLEERIKESPLFKTDRWNVYRDYLHVINEAKKGKKAFIEIDDIVRQMKGITEDDVRITMSVFHNMGFLLYFKDAVKDKIFIDPAVLLNFLYKEVLNEKVKANEGYITNEDMKLASRSNKHLNLSDEDVLRLLIAFDLVFEIDGQEGYYAPQYLPQNNSGWIEFFGRYHFSKPSIRIESDSYLMNLALLKLFRVYGKFVKKGSKGGEYLFWKDGILIEKKNQLLLVKFDRKHQAFELYGDTKGDNLKLQKEVVNFILNLKNDASDNVPLSDGEGEKVEMREVSWSNKYFTIKLTADGENYIDWCLLESTKYPTVTIGGKVFNTKDFEKYLPKSKTKLKIFISYSKADLDEVHKFIGHLAVLRRNEIIDNWYDVCLEPGQNWDDEIKANFDDSDIACFIISRNFMQTDYIHDKEIPYAFDRIKRDKNFKIVPIYLNYCDWHTKENYLGQFNALPFALKPIVEFKNQDMAWYIVEQALRRIIEENLSLRGTDLPKDIRQIYERITKGEV